VRFVAYFVLFVARKFTKRVGANNLRLARERDNQGDDCERKHP
jgi:hypothetical protein